MIPGVAPVNPVSGPAPLATFFYRMRSIAPAPSNHHSVQQPYVPAGLRTASHVYVRHDAARRPLQRPYDGPYRVLEAGDKVFTILRQGTPYVVSVDRLKPAIVPAPPTSPAVLPPSLEVSPPARIQPPPLEASLNKWVPALSYLSEIPVPLSHVTVIFVR